MKLKYLGMIITLLLNINNIAKSCNTKLLGLKAENFKSQFWSQTSILEDSVVKHLTFLGDPEVADQKYRSAEKFTLLYLSVKDKIQDEEFHRFADICKKLYESAINVDEYTAISVHMLLEEVGKKYYPDYKLLQKLKSYKKSRKSPVTAYSDPQSLEFFIHADKYMGVK